MCKLKSVSSSRNDLPFRYTEDVANVPHKESQYYRDGIVKPPEDFLQVFLDCAAYTVPHPAKTKPRNVAWNKNGDRVLFTPQVLGIADGVSRVAEEGLDPGCLPGDLLNQCYEALRLRNQDEATFDALIHQAVRDLQLERRPNNAVRNIVARAASTITEFGSTTLCFGVIRKSLLDLVNIGDSGFLQFRLTDNNNSTSVMTYNDNLSGLGYKLVAKTFPTVHSFNNPFQICRMPDTPIPSPEKLFSNTYLRATCYSFPLKDGDVLILATDGILDNLYDEDIAEVLNELCLPSVPHQVNETISCVPLIPPQTVATALVQTAVKRANLDCNPGEPIRSTPFADALCLVIGKYNVRGKPDDTTAIVAYVQSVSSPSKDLIQRGLEYRASFMNRSQGSYQPPFQENVAPQFINQRPTQLSGTLSRNEPPLKSTINSNTRRKTQKPQNRPTKHTVNYPYWSYDPQSIGTYDIPLSSISQQPQNPNPKYKYYSSTRNAGVDHQFPTHIMSTESPVEEYMKSTEYKRIINTEDGRNPMHGTQHHNSMTHTESPFLQVQSSASSPHLVYNQSQGDPLPTICDYSQYIDENPGIATKRMYLECLQDPRMQLHYGYQYVPSTPE